MRITSGRYKGRHIQTPKGIRPTQEKTRKALFDILGDIEGLSFLELFAGSGAIGLEAASRGIKELTLVEYNRDCIIALQKNIESLGAKACSLYPREATLAVEALHKQGKKFDIIFLDPPYYQGAAYRSRPGTTLRQPGESLSPRLRSGSVAGQPRESLSKKTLQTLGAYDILSPNGIVVVQHFKKDNLPENAGDLSLFRQARYGDTVLSFYRKE